MINIPMYWLLIEAFLGGAIALVLHEAIERITFERYLRRFKVHVLSEVDELKEKNSNMPAEDENDES